MKTRWISARPAGVEGAQASAAQARLIVTVSNPVPRWVVSQYALLAVCALLLLWVFEVSDLDRQLEWLFYDPASARFPLKHSWFLEEGTRLLYIVPRPRTDEILPLTIDPAPQQTIRVLVGRLEILPAAEEQRLIEVVRSSRRDRAVTKAASGVPAELLRLGRFAEPALVRLAHVARDDAEVREEAASLLCLIRSKEFAADDGQP